MEQAGKYPDFPPVPGRNPLILQAFSDSICFNSTVARIVKTYGQNTRGLWYKSQRVKRWLSSYLQAT